MLTKNINILGKKKNKNIYEYKTTNLNILSEKKAVKTDENEPKNLSDLILSN